MPKLAEAALLAVGTVVALENATNFDTKELEGVKALVHTGDGYINVKLKTELANQIKPAPGTPVAWLVRPGSNGTRDGGANTYYSFVGLPDQSYLDNLNTRIPRKAA